MHRITPFVSWFVYKEYSSTIITHFTQKQTLLTDKNANTNNWVLLLLWSPYGIGETIIFSCCSLFFLLFFPRLISPAADWMSAILPHMVWPWCEFKMQVWNLLHAACWKHRTQKVAKNRHLGTIAQLWQAISSQLKHVSAVRKKLKQQYVLHMSPQYGELWPTSGWDRFTSLGHPCKLQAFASWQRYCTAVKLWASAKLCGVEQRAPPVFGRATITLGIGPHF